MDNVQNCDSYINVPSSQTCSDPVCWNFPSAYEYVKHIVNSNFVMVAKRPAFPTEVNPRSYGGWDTYAVRKISSVAIKTNVEQWDR
jgi:hypothetical protein